MAVATFYAPASFTANGVQVAFSGNFKIFEETDLLVYTVTGGIQSAAYVLNGGGSNGYTVVFDSDDETWTVTFNVAPAVGTNPLVLRSTSLTQETVWPREEPTPSEDTENAVDKLTLIAQELLYAQTQGSGPPSTESSGPAASMPANPGFFMNYTQIDSGQYFRFNPILNKWILLG